MYTVLNKYINIYAVLYMYPMTYFHVSHDSFHYMFISIANIFHSVPFTVQLKSHTYQTWRFPDSNIHINTATNISIMVCYKVVPPPLTSSK